MAYTLSSPALHAAAAASRRTARGRCAARVVASATATAIDAETGIERARAGIKVAAEENALTPRFYTTGAAWLGWRRDTIRRPARSRFPRRLRGDGAHVLGQVELVYQPAGDGGDAG